MHGGQFFEQEDNELEQDKVSDIENKRIIIEKHEIIENGSKYMIETYTDNGFTITVNIPDRTPERQKERDKEIERRMVALYKSIVASGRGDIYKTHDKESA